MGKKDKKEKKSENDKKDYSKCWQNLPILDRTNRGKDKK